MIYILIIFCMILTSCSNNTDNTQPNIQSPSPAPTVKAEPIITEMPQSTPEVEPDVVSNSKTPLLDKTPERIHNIKLAAKAADGCLIKKGDVFSFNEIVGNRTEERGYKVAAILVGEKHQEGIGGGVCQVATTIYNAAKKADMKIIEHHTHKVEVEYAPDGSDATVNYDDLDMKFKNTSEYDIVIDVKIYEDTVNAEIRKT